MSDSSSNAKKPGIAPSSIFDAETVIRPVQSLEPNTATNSAPLKSSSVEFSSKAEKIEPKVKKIAAVETEETGPGFFSGLFTLFADFREDHPQVVNRAALGLALIMLAGLIWYRMDAHDTEEPANSAGIETSMNSRAPAPAIAVVQRPPQPIAQPSVRQPAAQVPAPVAPVGSAPTNAASDRENTNYGSRQDFLSGFERTVFEAHQLATQN